MCDATDAFCFLPSLLGNEKHREHRMHLFYILFSSCAFKAGRLTCVEEKEKELSRGREKDPGRGDLQAGPRPYNTTNQLMVICNCRVAACYYRSKARKGCADCCYCCCCWFKHCCCNKGKRKGSWETHGFLIDSIFKDHQRRIQTVDANFCHIFFLKTTWKLNIESRN